MNLRSQRIRLTTSVALASLPLLLAGPTHADELLTNGGFETGDFTGWTRLNLPTSDPAGTFAIGNNTVDNNLTPPGPATPIAELASLGAKSGNFYAVSDSLGPGTHLLLQSFTMPNASGSARISWDMFVNDWFGAGALNQNGPLDHLQIDGQLNLIPTQFARVDLLTALADPYDIAGGVVANLYNGVDLSTPANDYTHYTAYLGNLTPGATYQLRFAEVDNQFNLNQGIDNVSAEAVTPEPGTLALLLGISIAASAVFGKRLRRRRDLKVNA
jgi:hypothetical protein